MIRTATFASQQLNLSHQLRAQADWTEASIQASSGKASRDYVGIARDSQRLISLENLHVEPTGTGQTGPSEEGPQMRSTGKKVPAGSEPFKRESSPCGSFRKMADFRSSR